MKLDHGVKKKCLIQVKVVGKKVLTPLKEGMSEVKESFTQ